MERIQQRFQRHESPFQRPRSEKAGRPSDRTPREARERQGPFGSESRGAETEEERSTGTRHGPKVQKGLGGPAAGRGYTRVPRRLGNLPELGASTENRGRRTGVRENEQIRRASAEDPPREDDRAVYRVAKPDQECRQSAAQ